MPPKKKMTQAEMQSLIQAQKKQLEDQLKVIETLNAREKKAPHDREISRPKGQCGRGANSGHGGYSLEKSMGLQPAHYQRIQRIVRFLGHRILNPKKTFRQQDKTQLRRVKTMAVQRAPVLSNFRKAWPVDEVLKQWLSYISNSIKKDFLAEAEDAEEPNRDAVKKYLESLSRGGKAADSDSEASGSDFDIDEIRKELAEGNGDSDVEDEQTSKASKKRKGRTNIVDDEANQTAQRKASNVSDRRHLSKTDDENEIPANKPGEDDDDDYEASEPEASEPEESEPEASKPKTSRKKHHSDGSDVETARSRATKALKKTCFVANDSDVEAARSMRATKAPKKPCIVVDDSDVEDARPKKAPKKPRVVVDDSDVETPMYSTPKAAKKRRHSLIIDAIIDEEPKTLKSTKRDASKTSKQSNAPQKAAVPEIEDEDAEEAPLSKAARKGKGKQLPPKDAPPELSARFSKGKGRENHTSAKAVSTLDKHLNPPRRMEEMGAIDRFFSSPTRGESQHDNHRSHIDNAYDAMDRERELSPTAIRQTKKHVTFNNNSKETQTQKQAVKRKSTALGSPSPIKKARIQESSPRKPKGKTSRSSASASPRKRTPKTARARKLVPPSYEVNGTALNDNYQGFTFSPTGSPSREPSSSPQPEGTPRSLLKQQYCPSIYCKDRLPAEPHRHLQLLLEQAKRKKMNSMAALTICVEIKKSIELTKFMEEAKKQKWPTSIDFEALPKRITKFKPRFMQFFSDPTSFDLTPSWASLVIELQKRRMTFDKFNSLGEASRMEILPAAYNAGYYGPMGRSIIVSTVRYGLGFSGLERKFHETFRRYVADKLSNLELASPAFWIAVSNAAPLALNQLFECVFAPYTSELLIAQDLAVDEGKASIVREHSKVYGELIIDANAEDGLLDSIIQSIMHTDLEDIGPLNTTPQVDFAKLKRKPVPKQVLPTKSTKENVKPLASKNPTPRKGNRQMKSQKSQNSEENSPTLPQESSSHIATSARNQLGPQDESMTIDQPEPRRMSHQAGSNKKRTLPAVEEENEAIANEPAPLLPNKRQKRFSQGHPRHEEQSIADQSEELTSESEELIGYPTAPLLNEATAPTLPLPRPRDEQNVLDQAKAKRQTKTQQQSLTKTGQQLSTLPPRAIRKHQAKPESLGMNADVLEEEPEHEEADNQSEFEGRVTRSQVPGQSNKILFKRLP